MRFNGHLTRDQVDDLQVDLRTLLSNVLIVQVVEVTGETLVENIVSTQSQVTIFGDRPASSIDGTSLRSWAVKLELSVGHNGTDSALGVGQDTVLESNFQGTFVLARVLLDGYLSSSSSADRGRGLGSRRGGSGGCGWGQGCGLSLSGNCSSLDLTVSDLRDDISLAFRGSNGLNSDTEGRSVVSDTATSASWGQSGPRLAWSVTGSGNSDSGQSGR